MMNNKAHDYDFDDGVRGGVGVAAAAEHECRRKKNTTSTSELIVDESLVFEVEKLLKAFQKERQHTEEQVLLATVCALQRQFNPKLVNEALMHSLNSKPTPPLLLPNLNNTIVPPMTITIPTKEGSELSPSQTPRKPVRAYLDGCFDLMHSGHYNAIRQAKAICDELVVGVHSDAEILRNKGPPVMNDDERMAAVRACKWIDHVEFDTPYTPSIELLDRLDCDFCVHGDDIPVGADGVDAYSKVRDAGRFRIIKRTEGVSTTDLVGRLLLLTKDHHLVQKEMATTSGAMTPPTMDMTPTSTSWKSSTISSSSSPQTLDSDAGSDVMEQGVSLAGLEGRLSLLSMENHEGEDGTTISTPTMKSKTLNTTLDSARTPATPNQEQRANRRVSGFLPTTWRLSQFANHRKPKPDDTIVYVDGSFDMFHVGHIEALEKVAQLGTFVYVGLFDDDTINEHAGSNFPIMNLHERVLNVLSCKYVDEVVMGAPFELTKDLCRTLDVSIVASLPSGLEYMNLHPSDSTIEGGRDDNRLQEIQPLDKIRICTVTTSRPLSTDDVIHRIVDNRMKYEKRNKTRVTKEENYLADKSYVQEV